MSAFSFPPINSSSTTTFAPLTDSSEEKKSPPPISLKSDLPTKVDSEKVGQLFTLVECDDMQFVDVIYKAGLCVTNVDPSKHFVVVGRGYIDSKTGKKLINIALGLYSYKKLSRLKNTAKILKKGNFFINRVEIDTYAKMDHHEDVYKKKGYGVGAKIIYRKNPIGNFSTFFLNDQGMIEMRKFSL